MSLPHSVENGDMPTIRILAAADADAVDVWIHGPIGEDLFAQGVTSQRFAEDLSRHRGAKVLRVDINSPGGSFADGLSIHSTLKAHGARVDVTVSGQAASIASLIAMAGSSIHFAPGALMLVHSPHALCAGNAEALRQFAEVLDKHENAMIDIYSARTGQPREAIKAMLDAETWLNGAEAEALGFADSHDEALPIAASIADYRSQFAVFASELTRNTAMTTANVSATEVLAAEQNRTAGIRAVFAKFPGHASVMNECIADQRTDIAAAAQRLLEKISAGTEPLAGGYFNATPQHDFRAAAVDALCIRAGIAVQNPHAAARDLQSMSVMEMARACLSQVGKSHRGMNGGQLIKAAMTSSDFPYLLENSIGKALRNGYESDPQSHAAWVRKTMVPDFKTASRLLLGSAPALEQVIEAGEYTYGSLSENKASLAVLKYGKALRLTWEALINDDLAAFMRLPQSMGAAARRAEADAVYTVFTANSGAGQTMQDSVALFHSGSHANVSATVGAISTATLGAARALLRKQTALGNGGYLNLNPAFLIVPAESETLAEQILATASRHTVDTVSTTGRKVEGPPPEWISKLQLVVEPRLNASYGFYVAASYNQIDTVELATLEADGGAPVVEEENEFNVDAKNYKVRHVFVAKAIDWKGLVRVPVS